jgi:hypothetical protein
MRAGLVGVLVMAGLLAVAPAGIGSAAPRDKGGDPVAAHWTAARQKSAIPRDLVLDERGRAFRRGAKGTLVPHGHSDGQLYATPVATAKPTPAAKPGGGDKTGPSVTLRDPATGATLTTSSYTFKATVTDTSGVGSVSFRITLPSGSTQTFGAALGTGNVWSATISGFTNGSWSWQVIAKDRARPANTTTTGKTGFTVSLAGGGGGGTGTTVTNAAWTGGGTVQNAAGRVYFEMPTNSSLTSWGGYVCSGTVAEDATTGRSVIITAAHCVYDDVHKVFARNIIFIPNQDGTTAGGTDRNCANDPIGCWTTSFGVVDRNWTTRTFPDNIPWDYGFYVVSDAGAHTQGMTATGDVLDTAAGDLFVQTATAPTTGVYTHALGYSYSEDPSFMYCAENMGTNGAANWWLSKCDLSGGSSGGPWMQPVSSGNGPIVSVNSWGYTNQPGMAGPKLHGTSAGCVFTRAKGQTFDTTTLDARGTIADC